MSSGPILLAALGVILFALGLIRRATTRLDFSRSVLVRAPIGTAWEFVRRVPEVLARHGKVRERGGLDDWALRHGDGEAAGSIWRGHGRWDAADYWADVELVRIHPEREVAVRLLRDSLGTHRGLRDHLGVMRLEPIAPGATKVTWVVRARLRGPRLRLVRILSPGALRARLLDQGLRSIKMAIEATLGPPGAPEGTRRPRAGAPEAAPPPAPPGRPPEAPA